MKILLTVLGLGWLSLTAATATVIEPQFGRAFWATGYVRSINHVLVFDLVTETVHGNSGGSKLGLGTTTEHIRLLQYFEAAKKKGIKVRLHGFLVKNPPNVVAQMPTAPTIEFRVDKMHATNERDS
jgi:hypothetical protein